LFLEVFEDCGSEFFYELVELSLKVLSEDAKLLKLRFFSRNERKEERAKRSEWV
jgi:hypothetical protein